MQTVLLNVRHPRGAVHLAAPVRVKHINAGQVGADAGFAGFAVGCRESHAVLGAQFTRHTPRPHGGKDNPYEAIKVIDAWDLDKDFYLGNAVKYLSRAGKKDNVVQDLKKAVWYIEKKIEKLQND